MSSLHYIDKQPAVEGFAMDDEMFVAPPKRAPRPAAPRPRMPGRPGFGKPSEFFAPAPKKRPTVDQRAAMVAKLKRRGGRFGAQENFGMLPSKNTLYTMLLLLGLASFAYGLYCMKQKGQL